MLTGALGQPFARFWVKTRAIRLTHRLEGKRQDKRIPDQSFKIHVVVLNLEVSFFFSRIREKLLKLDFDRLSDVAKASSALSDVLTLGRSGDENPFVHGLEAGVERHLRIRRKRDDPLSPTLG